VHFNYQGAKDFTGVQDEVKVSIDRRVLKFIDLILESQADLDSFLLHLDHLCDRHLVIESLSLQPIADLVKIRVVYL